MARARSQSESGVTEARVAGALRALPWIAVLIAVWPLLRGGFPEGHDWLYELVRVVEYGRALAEGQLPPAWAPDLYAGFGSPIFLFYAPLFSAAAAALSALVGDPARAATLLLMLGAALGALGMQRLLREVSESPGAGRVAACVYALHPYLLCDALLRNANAEYLALALAPYPLVGVLSAARSPRTAVLWIALGLALVVLAHNLTALWVSALLLASAALLAERGERLRTLVPCAAGIALGLSLSAGFWLPALSLTGQIRAEALLTGKFDFHRQFPPLGGVFGYQRFYAVGLLTPLCWVAAAVALRAGRGSARERRVLAWTLAASAACLVLLLPGSAPLWETLPLLPFYQFPWRFLGPLALLTATAAGLAFAMLEGRLPGRARAPAELAVLALCAANALPHLLDARELSPRLRERLPEVLTPATIQREALPATVGDEYLPRAADPGAWLDGVPEGPVVGRVGTIVARVLLDHGAHVELALGEGASGRLELRRFAFPGWRVELDGRPLATEVSARGALLVPVHGGGTLSARFVGTPLVRAARVVSGIAGLVWLMLWIGPLVRRARS